MTARERTSTDGQADSLKPVRIVLADDHQVMRHGLRMLLDAEPDLDVVAEVGDIGSARRSVREHAPNVLLLDLNMPGGSALEAIPSLRAEAPNTQIVVLSMQDDPEVVWEARRAGALGYVLKEAADSDLLLAIHRAAEGELYLNRKLAERLIVHRSRASGWD